LTNKEEKKDESSSLKKSSKKKAKINLSNKYFNIHDNTATLTEEKMEAILELLMQAREEIGKDVKRFPNYTINVSIEDKVYSGAKLDNGAQKTASGTYYHQGRKMKLTKLTCDVDLIGTYEGCKSLVFHEYAHAVSGDSSQRPAWFEEGVAEYFSEPEPAPGRGVRVYEKEDLRTVKELVHGKNPYSEDGSQNTSKDFIRYDQSQEIISYIVEKKGEKAIRRMQYLYDQGYSSELVIKNVMGVSITTFDKQFKQWLNENNKIINNKKKSGMGLTSK